MFGDRLRELRLEKKLNQVELAKIINVHRAVIGKYETHKRSPSKEILLALADYFNVSTDFLLCRTDVHTPFNKDINYVDLTGFSPEDSAMVKKLVGLIKLKMKVEQNKKP